MLFLHLTESESGHASPDTTDMEAVTPVAATSATASTEGQQDEIYTSAASKPASSPTIAGSTVVVHSQESEPATQGPDAKPMVTAVAPENLHNELQTGHSYPQEAINSFTTPTSSLPSFMASQETKASPASPTKTGPMTTTTVATAAHHQTERHIPSYEQWRKQVLEKKNKPADANERKQRKRKPYQESAVDVAIGGEDELGFVFPNLDSAGGSGKSGEDRFQQVSDQLGNGPDLKTLGKDKEWIKSEYAKDPKDRFNHASATCAASVVKASKDATSVTAILNEGKDNYMLNKCSTKEKFFVVELCEEILVDTFILGNYEFFSSTFKDFVVSVNRYPPRDDGWSILGYFQARNTRDAQVFKPTVPQLATYIRFDFVSHYGNEYYCPVTLLRVYGATALEQLKQEEEEEKRVAEEEKRRAELEKANQAAAEEEEETEEAEETEAEGDNNDNSYLKTENSTAPTEITDVSSGSQNTLSKQHEAPEDQSESSAPPGNIDTLQVWDVVDSHSSQTAQDSDMEGSQKDPSNTRTGLDTNLEHTEAGVPTFVFPDPPSIEPEEGLHLDDSTPGSTWIPTEDMTTASTEYSPTEIIPPLPSTSPASMQDGDDWGEVDLGMITLSQRTKPTPPSASKTSSSGPVTMHGGASNTDTASHPTASPQHSSQESVYKNIVNRLKVLELNSSLSYQYLEEQSNVFNEVIESSEQKLNQLVTHLNEANRRLETLGRKYDQLAYSYKAHVEIDGAKRRQDFLKMSSQIHLLGSQVMFQRQLFVVTAITLFSVFAFFAITRSSSMQYAIQQSTIAAKIKAISGHVRDSRPSDISRSIRIGSIEALRQFDQKVLQEQHLSEDCVDQAREDGKFTPPISPMSPLTPDPDHGKSRFMEDQPRGGSTMEVSCPDSGSLTPNGHPPERDHGEKIDLSLAQSATSTPAPSHLTDKPLELQLPDLQLDRFVVTRTPYSTPKGSRGPGHLFLQQRQQEQQQQPYSSDYRPDSPVFQGPSSTHDEGQLSDADVAYMSRDMNVGRAKKPASSSSSGSASASPAMTRHSASYYNQFQNPLSSSSAARPSSLRRDTTASMSSPTKSDSDSPRAGQSPANDKNNVVSEGLDRLIPRPDTPTKVFHRPNTHNSFLERTPEMTYNDDDEDAGFVSDSVLDSASESKTSSRELLQKQQKRERHPETLGDWDRQLGVGEVVPKQEDDDDERNEATDNPWVGATSRDGSTNGFIEHGENADKEPLRRTRSRRSTSQSIDRSQEQLPFLHSHCKNRSLGGAFELGVGLGLDLGLESKAPATVPSPVHHGAAEGDHQMPQLGRNFVGSESDDSLCDDDGTAAAVTIKCFRRGGTSRMNARKTGKLVNREKKATTRNHLLGLKLYEAHRFGATKTRIIVDGQRTGQGSAVTFQDLILDEEPQVSSKLWQDINEKDYQFEDDKDKVEETLDHQISMIPSNDIQDDKGLIKTPEEEGLLNHEHQQQHDQQHRRYQQQQGQQHHRMYSKDYQHREWQESSSSSAQRNVIGIEDRGAEVILSPIVATRQKEKEELIYEVEKANGVFVILTREEDIQATRETIRQVEDRFNRDRNYPWVILSPLPLTDGSKNRIRTLSKGRMTFGTIPREHWRLPTWIEPPRVLSGDYERMKIGLERTSLDKRRQWRYQSGFLARHELLDGFEFFWRVEPGMDIFCDIEDDPMLAMKKNGHLFAWSHSELIREAGVPGAWSLIQRFKETHGDLIPKSNDEAFLKREGEDA
ncbi:hypothetical protein BGX28_002571 [Mortierella sp. GBA30]|nr:hypothetical protein BGX28_002571 [Mortierella sp. GBA30]